MEGILKNMYNQVKLGDTLLTVEFTVDNTVLENSQLPNLAFEHKVKSQMIKQIAEKVEEKMWIDIKKEEKEFHTKYSGQILILQLKDLKAVVEGAISLMPEHKLQEIRGKEKKEEVKKTSSHAWTDDDHKAFDQWLKKEDIPENAEKYFHYSDVDMLREFEISQGWTEEVAVEEKERFKKPTGEQLTDIAIIFNEGRLDAEGLVNMVAMAMFVADRLHENGDVMVPTKREGEISKEE